MLLFAFFRYVLSESDGLFFVVVGGGGVGCGLQLALLCDTLRETHSK
jgi:hypothetical protein